MSKVTHAAIRAAGLGDMTRILAEYGEAIKNLPLAESANLLSRPYSEFKTAVENGLFFIVENEAGNFMAGAGAFDLADPTVKELGMCYVKKEWRGFGLQTLLLNVRVVPSEHQHQHHLHQLGPSQAGNLLKLLPPINQIPLVLAL